MKSAHLIDTWKYSFKFLFCKEAKSLWSEIFLNFRQALNLTVKYFWWLLVFCLVIPFFILKTGAYTGFVRHVLDGIYSFDIGAQKLIHSAFPLSTPKNHWIAILLVVLFGCAWATLLFTLFPSTRVSSEEKTFSYYLYYTPKVFAFFMYTLFIFIFSGIFLFVLLSFVAHDYKAFTDRWGVSIMTMIIILLASLPFLAGYAFLDGEKNVIKKGFALLFYFFPLMVSVTVIQQILLFVLQGATRFIWGISLISPFLLIGINFSMYFVGFFLLGLLVHSCYATLYYKIKKEYPRFLEYNEKN